MVDFQSLQATTIQAFGFVTTVLFCIEALARIASTAWNVIKTTFNPTKENKENLNKSIDNRLYDE